MGKKKVVRMKPWEGWCLVHKERDLEHGEWIRSNYAARRFPAADDFRYARVRVTEIVPKKKPAKGRKGAKK